MTVPLFSPRHKGGVNAALKGLEKIEGVYLSGAHQLYDSYIRRILKPHRARQVSSGVRTKLATKRDNFRFKLFHISHPEKYFINKRLLF
jgi:hypothetical protein